MKLTINIRFLLAQVIARLAFVLRQTAVAVVLYGAVFSILSNFSSSAEAQANFQIVESSSWRAFSPSPNQSNNPINQVGGGWEAANVGWNSDLNFNDTSSGGWTNTHVFPTRGMWSAITQSSPTYFRKKVTIDDPISFVDLDILVDDDSFVYINGVQVLNDRTGVIEFLPHEINITGLLHQGENLIAIKGHDSFGGDQGIRMKIQGTTTPTPGASGQTLIDIGSQWKYLDDGSNQSTLWRSPAYDDSAWQQGNGQFGYGEGDEATTVSFGGDPNNKFATTYFRKTFNVSQVDIIESLRMAILRDDGAAVYINGQEVWRSKNLAPNAAYNSYGIDNSISNSEEMIFENIILRPGVLFDGENTIAVEIHQFAPDSSDVSFDLQLSTIFGKEMIAYTTFDEPSLKVGTYNPGSGANELGFSTAILQQTTNQPRAEVRDSDSPATSPVLIHQSVTATTSFDEVDLRQWEDARVELLVKVSHTGHEDEDFLRIFVTNGTENIFLVNESGDDGSDDDSLDNLGDEYFEMHWANIPDTWETAILVIESSSDSSSTTNREHFAFDNIQFLGVYAVPEPSSIVALMIGLAVLCVRGWSRRKK